MQAVGEAMQRRRRFFLTDNNKTHYIMMKNPKRIHKLPKPAPAPKKLTLSLEDKDGKPLDPPLDGTDRLLILQAIQFNNINAPVDQFAKLFQTDEASIEADIEHLKQLQQRVRLRINAVSDKPKS